MTIPTERYNSLKRTEKFLTSMLKNEWIPKGMRDEAYACLRHFPWDIHLEDLAEASPNILEKPVKYSDGDNT
jgi:hypothetical protein